MNLLTALAVIAIIFIIAYGVYFLLLWILRKRSATMVESSDIQAHKRFSQIVDLREAAEYNANHIMGARNIPFSQFKMRFQEIRKDQAVYLYDAHLNYASRAANILFSKGYRQIHILKGGFETWTGKTKSNVK